MTAKEIDNKMTSGERLTVVFSIRKRYYKIGKERITEKQFNAARERFKDRLECYQDFGGITEHHYTIKK